MAPTEGTPCVTSTPWYRISMTWIKEEVVFETSTDTITTSCYLLLVGCCRTYKWPLSFIHFYSRENSEPDEAYLVIRSSWLARCEWTARFDPLISNAHAISSCILNTVIMRWSLTLIQPASKWMHRTTLWRHCHSDLFWAATSASSEVIPILDKSLLTAQLQFARGRPGPLLNLPVHHALWANFYYFSNSIFLKIGIKGASV